MLGGIAMFKSWGLWLGYRFGFSFVRKKGMGLFHIRGGPAFKINYAQTDVGTLQEVWLMDLYQKHYRAKPGDVVIDIGANFGAFAVLAAKSGATVYAYEPTPRQFDLLSENTRGLPVHCYKLAVAGKSGEINIYEAPGGDAGNSVIYNEHLKRIPFVAKAITLREIINETGRCDFLKIDCEGSEVDILRTAPREIFARIDNIALEYHDNLEEMKQIFRTLDYKFVTPGKGKYGYLYAWRGGRPN